MESTFTLTDSYYCCRLRTGSIVICITDLVAGVIGALILAAVTPEKPLFKLSWLPIVHSGLLPAIIIFVFAVVFGFVAGLVLIFGVKDRSANSLLAYLIFSGVAIIFCWIAWGLALHQVPQTPWYFILISVILLLLSFYHWAIVFSYFVVLIAADDGTSEASISYHGFLQRVYL